MARGLTRDGVEALHTALTRHVERGDMPGLVALVACGDDVHVETIGHPDVVSDFWAAAHAAIDA